MKKLLIIPDMHVPYHDKRATSLVLRMAQKVGFDHLITLGDFVDFFKVSFHERTLEKRMSFAEEVKEARRVRAQFDALGIPRKDYIEGNHEFRFDRYLAGKAPELADLPGLTVPELLELPSHGWRFTPYKQELRVGKLWITHDEGSSGPLASIRARSTYGGNVVIGHCHAMAVTYKGNARGESHVGASFGWLGDVKRVDYLHQVKARQWQLGVGVGCMESNGTVHLSAVPIINNKMCVFGQIYT